MRGAIARRWRDDRGRCRRDRRRTAAEHAGRLAAFEALRRLGRIDAARRDALATADRRARRSQLAVRRFLDVLYAPRDAVLRPADDVVVCRCEEISRGSGA